MIDDFKKAVTEDLGNIENMEIKVRIAEEKDVERVAMLYERYAILVREEFSCLINSHEQGHEQLDSGKLNTGGH